MTNVVKQVCLYMTIQNNNLSSYTEIPAMAGIFFFRLSVPYTNACYVLLFLDICIQYLFKM